MNGGTPALQFRKILSGLRLLSCHRMPSLITISPRLLALATAALMLTGCAGQSSRQSPEVVGVASQASSSDRELPPIRIGLALGGGAAKGFAHVGVIKMLEANGIAVSAVSGTSAGSVVGALYASGMTAFELQEKAVALDEAKIRDIQISSGGLLVGQKLEDYVNEQVRRKPLEQLAKPFVAVATRLEDGERTVFAQGNTGQAVRASASVPGVFRPVSIGRFHYVDGGVVSPVPVDAARQLGADMVVAVDISSKATGKTPKDMLGTVNQSIAIMGQKLGQAELARADVVIHPKVLEMGAADFTQRAAAILEGEKAALAAIPQIRQKLEQLQADRLNEARKARQKAAEDAYKACMDGRSRLSKLTDMAGLGEACQNPAPVSR